MRPNTSTEHICVCRSCEAVCGLRVAMEDGQLGKIRPNGDDVWSRGYI